MLQGYFDYHVPFVLGFDLAGVVVAVGENIRRFRPGDRVFGTSRQGEGYDGAYAEYCLARETMLAPLPGTLSPSAAASLPTAGTTAYGALVAVGGLQAGKRVLINGGAGGVGSIAIQIAVTLGARVAVTCSAGNADYVRALGAECVIDYRTEDVPQAVRRWAPDRVDLVVDTVGVDTLLPHVIDLVQPGGRFVEIMTLISEASEAIKAKAAERGIQILSNMIAANRISDHFQGLAAVYAAGCAKPPQIQSVPLDAVGVAHQQVRDGHVRGKIVLEISNPADW
jgi:NADPH:quinone reductase-like Zn-dependent oxidoreductase